ncbi:hypothetical protein AAHE38_002417 [Escherichia coli]
MDRGAMDIIGGQHLRQMWDDLADVYGHKTALIDAPRDKRTYFREINYIAAAFQYQKKNYKSA